MNFVCIVFELGDKMLTLSSMENLIVPCNLYHIWAWRPSWSCDLDHLYKLSYPSQGLRRLNIKFGFDWPSSFSEEDV